MNLKLKFSIIAIVILITLSIYLISYQEIEPPPPAILEIDGKEQVSGIGSYCWKGTLKALCVDYAGIPTPQVPLHASSPFTAQLRLPEESPYELQFNLVQVTKQDEYNFSAYEWRLWNIWDLEGKRLTLPLEREQDIELSLEPGLYVLNIEAWWDEKGSASYGFLVEVRANGTGASPEQKIDISKIKKYPNDGDYLSSEGYSTKILLSGSETGGEYPTTLDSKILLLNYSLNYTTLKNEDICLPYTANPGDPGILIRVTLKNKYDKDYWITLSASACDSNDNLLGRSLDSGPICGIIARYVKSNETENFELHLKHSNAISKINLSGGLSEIMPP